MKKIYFVFAMLLMSITSALAEESSNELTPEEFFLTDYEITYYGNDFTVYGEACDNAGMVINGGRKITIRSNNGAKITKVEYAIGWGEEYSEHLMVSSGNVSSSDYFIYDVNATTLEIYSDVEGETDRFQIDYMKVFYEKADEGNNGENVKPLVLDEYVQTESFSIGYCDGRNVTIKGTGTGGFDIANGNTVNITEKDHVDNITAKDHVEILKVELGLSADNNDALINSSAGIVEGSGENRTINNVNSSSLTISYSGTGNVRINNIKVYYIKFSEETSVTFVTKTGKEYSEDNIALSATKSVNGWGVNIDKGNSVTVSSDSGAEISKVKLHLGYYYGSSSIESTEGTVEKGKDNYNWTIRDINKSSMTISHPGQYSDNSVQIDEITVYYKKKEAPSTIEVVAKPADGACWTTFYSNASNYKAPEGTQVFKVKLSGVDITMTEIVDRIVTKGQGVVLKSTNSNIEMSKTDSVSSDGYSGNCLLGTSVSITNPNPGKAYVLSYSQSNGVGFYKLSSTGTIGINKAYLVYDGAVGARSFFTFEETATGIEMNKIGGNEGNDKVYDLQGRRVANPSNGIYIVNGKKVIMNRH